MCIARLVKIPNAFDMMYVGFLADGLFVLSIFLARKTVALQRFSSNTPPFATVGEYPTFPLMMFFTYYVLRQP